MFDGIYAGRRVLVTGHTGFKGSWLALWLTQLGAEVAGYSSDIPTTPSNFEALGLAGRIRHYVGDVRDPVALAAAIDEFRPEIVFHLAAQALVRRSYVDPVTTFQTNTLGTLNLLECLRQRPWIEVGVFITSDKSYRNNEWCWGYRETDPLGGDDPYSGSKGCAELVVYSYQRSFFMHSNTRIATTRAGNVIGGGDWAEDRIVPDCMRAWSRSESVLVRSPHATRPWQHVLEPLSGYLWLGSRLWREPAGCTGEAFNFGPDANVNQTVGELLDAMAVRWPGVSWHAPEGVPAGARHEAKLLKLCCDKVLHELGWRAVLQFPETVAFTVDGYRAYYEGQVDMHDYTVGQIDAYCHLARERGLPWLN